MQDSVRSRVRAMAADELRGCDSVRLPEVTDKLLRVIKDSPALRDEFIDAMLRSMIYEEVHQAAKATRDMTVMGDLAVTEQGMAAERARVGSRFVSWLEHVGDRHRLVLDMTRAELLVAAQERRNRGGYEYRVADLWERVAAKLNSKQAVRDRFSVEQLDAMFEATQVGQEA